jgi:hypothetical protein
MVNKSDFANRIWFIRTERIISIFADLAVIIGIIFAFYQIIQSDQAEKRRVAIEAISETRSPEFLKAYTRLITACKAGNIEDKNVLIDDLNYVMNVYDKLAILYINELVDRCVIKNTISSAVEQLFSVLECMSYPAEKRKNLDTLIRLMKGENCE